MNNLKYSFSVIQSENSIQLVYKPCSKYKISDVVLTLAPEFNYGRIIMSGYIIDDPTEQMYYMVSWDKNKIDGPYTQNQIAEFRLNKTKYHSEFLKTSSFKNLKTQKTN